MSRDQRYEELYREALSGRLSRRQLLRRAAGLGLSVPAIGALLAACGGGGGSSSTATTGTTGGTSTSTVASPSASPIGSPMASPGASPSASPSGSPSASAPLTRQYAGTTLRWSESLAENERAVWDNKVIPDFQDKTGIKIQFLQIESGDFVNQLRAQVKANKVGVDIFGQDNNSLAPLVADNLIEDLSQYRNMIPSQTLNTMLPVLSFNNKLYFFPYRPNVMITYFNTGALQKYNLQTPKTWDDLTNVAKTLKSKEGIGRVAVQASPEGGAGPVGVTVTEFIWQAGGDPLVLNSPESVQAFTYLQQLNKYLNPQTPTAKYDTMITYLANNSVYLGQDWPFGVNELVQQDKRQDIHAYSGWAGPKGEIHVLGGEVIGIPKGSPHKEAALVFAQYLMSKETQELFTREIAWPAMRSDAFGTVSDWQKPYFDAVQNSLTHSKARPNVVYWGDVQNIMGNAWTEIVAGGAPVKSTLDKYQSQVDAAKKKAGA